MESAKSTHTSVWIVSRHNGLREPRLNVNSVVSRAIDTLVYMYIFQ